MGRRAVRVHFTQRPELRLLGGGCKRRCILEHGVIHELVAVEKTLVELSGNVPWLRFEEGGVLRPCQLEVLGVHGIDVEQVN